MKPGTARQAYLELWAAFMIGIAIGFLVAYEPEPDEQQHPCPCCCSIVETP